MPREIVSSFARIEDYPFLSLTTFRADGEPVMTPVWFARVGDRLYVVLPAHADDVRRIQHNAQVEVAPCTPDGDLLNTAVEAMAVILPPERSAEAHHRLNAKYGWQRRLPELLRVLRRDERVVVEITAM